MPMNKIKKKINFIKKKSWKKSQHMLTKLTCDPVCEIEITP
jgi:hypothetical protein